MRGCRRLRAGSAATLTLPGPFWGPGRLDFVEHGRGRRLVWDEPAVRHDAQHNSAVEVAQCIASGQRESPRRPLAETVPTLQALDEVRRHVGFGTPG